MTNLVVTVCVFNWNYGVYLKELLEKFTPCVNDPRVRMVICDDGSTDNSIEIINDYIKSFNVKNMSTICVSKNNLGRDVPYKGQLIGLSSFLNHEHLINDGFIWFMDADDYFDFDDFNALYNHALSEMPDLYILKVNNFTCDKDQGNILEIKRRISIKPKLWPTISVTSSLIASRQFIQKNIDLLLSFNPDYSDVWLDARINILGCTDKETKVIYSDKVVQRRIHSSGDSSTMPMLRRIKKQCKSLCFFRDALSDDFTFSTRTFLLSLIYKLFFK